MIGICVEPTRAFVERPNVAADCRVANFADSQADCASGGQMFFGPMDMVLEVEALGAHPEAAPVSGIDRRRMEVADDDGRTIIGNTRELSIGLVDSRQMPEHQAAPDNIE